jgi:hypothetical protein
MSFNLNFTSNNAAVTYLEYKITPKLTTVMSNFV